MLVLSRRIGEEIVIDEQIRVVVAAVQGDRVRLGICAPATVRTAATAALKKIDPQATAKGGCSGDTGLFVKSCFIDFGYSNFGFFR
jgi:carbon storage regulator CsrA